ncbi:MAG: DUF5615 family PIN-like protein, partial [Planctomycetales bacterium]|nr:DUF5615 family PIN-like protein [Planctomycetales bacterium]
MSIKLLLDMNLSPSWIGYLESAGWPCVHWSDVGDPRATDREIMNWAAAEKYVVFTHDLDFGTILALTHDSGPSVIQVRTQDVLPDKVGSLVVASLTQHADAL